MSAGRVNESEVRTTCPYCGVGCGLTARARRGRLVEVAGDPIYPVNRGRVCSKPLALPEASHTPDRATVPLRRDTRTHRWREVGWEGLIADVAERLLAIREEHGPDAIAFYISGQLLTEDYYAVNKLVKGFLGTNNVDSNSRLCMSSAVSGYRAAFGSDGPPPAYADIPRADCFLLLGTNTAACHPIVWTRIRDRQAEGAFVIVIDPRRTDTAAAADLHLPLRPGSDLALLNAMLHVIDREGLVAELVERRTEGWEEVRAMAARWPPERASMVCGVPAANIVEAARRFAAARGALALWSMGANQSTIGTLKNQALINLCLATGQIGRPGAGPLSLTGQPNAMGGREAGGLAQLLPGYRLVERAQDRAEMEALWRLPGNAAGISPRPGLVATDLFEALERGDVRAVWICATNPVVSMPDAGRARRALERAELVVCQDAYHPTETSAVADVVLPAAQWPEKEGTMTNSERRVGLVRKLIEPPGQALADWEIFARLARALGWPESFSWAGPAEVYEEFARCTAGRLCDQTGLSHERLRRDGGVQWPCPATRLEGHEHPGTDRLYEGLRFPTASGRERMRPTPHAEPAERPTRRYPLVLTTGRVASHWHTMTRTGKSRRLLEADSTPFVELHPRDARRAAVRDGRPARIVSRRGSAVLQVRIHDTLPEGTAFAPFHWGELHAPAGAHSLNAVTNGATDPTSRQPELKACAVRVEPVSAHPERSVRRRRRHLLVVGTGMAGQAAVEAALAHGGAARREITMIGREQARPYNRIKLSQALAGHVQESRLDLRPADWYGTHGVTLRTGTAVEGVDLERRVARTDAGDELPYDDLLLATGSSPAMPPIAGLDRRGVHAFRTLADARAIASDAKRGVEAVVIGGGLLGLEAARGLVERGARVTVVHLVDRLLETQIDALGARLLAREMRRVGVAILLGQTTTEVVGNGAVSGVRLASGEELAADLVVVATGARPETGLARAAGLEVGRGVLVDDELRTSAPRVWAVGECAEHRGQVYGVWSPLIEQARVAGASLAGAPTAFHGAVAATTLKVAGVDLFAAGRHSAEDDDEDEIVAFDTTRRRHRKLVVRDGRLAGAVLVGDLSLSPRLADLIRRGEPVPEGLLEGPVAQASPAAAESLVCTCNSVSRATIVEVMRDRDLRTVEQVAEATGACTGCGSCAPTVEAMLAERG